MTSSPDTPASSPVAPDSLSGAPIPGLPGHLFVAHVLDKLSDPTDLARVSAVSRGMRDAVAATGRTVMMPSEDEAVKKGYLSTVKHMHSRDRLSDTRLLCAAAAAAQGFASGEFSVGLADVRRRGGARPPRDAEVGAREQMPVGREHVLVRGGGRPPGDADGARERLPAGRRARLAAHRRPGAEVGIRDKCPWDDDDVRVRGGAASRVLKLARANDCPWDVGTCNRRHHGASCGRGGRRSSSPSTPRTTCFSGRARTAARGTSRRSRR